MRVADVLMSFPSFLLAAFVNASAKVPMQSMFDALKAQTGWAVFEDPLLVDYMVVFGALALVWWPGMARVVRGQVLSLKSHEFVTAARALGAPTWALLTRHLLPNALGPVIVAVTFGFGGAMLAEAGLSFLGIGIQPPGASWGKMINDNVGYWNTKPHLVMAPAMVLALAALAFNFVGDGLNDALNPRERRR
jgi:peptide/nickel transport system permease protein